MKNEIVHPGLISRLVDLLRQELREYGEMLALLNHQQERVLARNANEVLQNVSAINQQAEVIRTARDQRLASQHDLARALNQSDANGLLPLLPKLPEHQRYPVEALVRENNVLMDRVQQRARQNHLLLSRSLELMQRFISTLLPPGPPATYTGSAQIQSAAIPPQPIYEALG
ncbi:MAG TPA: flagellar export chaperone FlgN [Verrucomicrobiae bacterium]